MRIMSCGETQELRSGPHTKYWAKPPNFTCREWEVAKAFQEESSPKPVHFLLILPKIDIFWKYILEGNHSFVFSQHFWMGKSQKHGKVCTSPNSSHMIKDYMIILKIKQISKWFTKYFAHSDFFFLSSICLVHHIQHPHFTHRQTRVYQPSDKLSSLPFKRAALYF